MAGPQGGDVKGKTRIDVTMGEAIPVASSSFNAGYSDAMDDQYVAGKSRRVTVADLVQGYVSYGEAIGE